MPKLKKIGQWIWFNIKKGHSFILEHPNVIDSTLWGIGALALIVQFSTISAVLYQNTDSRAVVASRDDDSAAGIGNAEETYLINDNGVRLYGPVYYRLSSILRYYGINQYAEGYNKQEHKERSIYFHLMLLNLLGIYLSSYFLLCFVTDRKHFRLLGTWALVGAFLQNEMRSLLLLMAKPDHTFVLFLTLSLLFTWRWIQETDAKSAESTSFKWMSFAWGIAASTKLAFIFFIPGLLLMFYQKSKKEWFSLAKSFIKWTAISYFAIGFPQNFDFTRSLSYLIHQNGHASLVSIDFLIHQWLRLFYLDLKLPILFTTLFVILLSSPLEGQKIRWNWFFRMSLIFVLGTLWLISKQTKAPFQWYTFPFTNTAIACYAILLLKCLSLLPNSVLEKWNSVWKNSYYSIFIFFFIPVFVEPFPEQVWKTFQSQQGCRQEARKFETLVNEAASKNKTVLADPYAPYSRQFHDKQVRMAYEMTPEILERVKPDYVALKKGYYQIYMPKSEGGSELQLTHIENIEKTRSFYRVFFNKSETVDHLGQNWKKVYTDNCSFELWEKIP